MRLKLPAAYNIGVDLDAAVIRDWRSRIGQIAGAATDAAESAPRPGALGVLADRRRRASSNPPPSAALGVLADRRRRASSNPPPSAALGGFDGDRASASTPLVDPPTRDRYRFLRGDGLTFLASYPFVPEDLVYCDPPYLAETRSSGRLYQYEMSDQQHAELLSIILDLPCRVLISGYWSAMYASTLKDWNAIHFEAMTRGGMATEWVWFNFQAPSALHDCRYLGETAHQRQNLKRQIASWGRRLQRMSPLKRQALISALASVGESAAGIH